MNGTQFLEGLKAESQYCNFILLLKCVYYLSCKAIWIPIFSHFCILRFMPLCCHSDKVAIYSHKNHIVCLVSKRWVFKCLWISPTSIEPRFFFFFWRKLTFFKYTKCVPLEIKDSTNLDDLFPLVNMINHSATGDVLWFCVTWLWNHFHSCFVYGGHSLIVVCDINTERDSGTSVSKQQEPSLYSSCPGVTLMFCVRECVRALMRVEIIECFHV